MNNKTKEIATIRGQKLVNRLKNTLGGNWKLRVHENLGWHYNAYLGSIQVYQSNSKEYDCLISNEKNKPYYGAGIWGMTNTASTPRECVIKQMKLAEEVVAGYVDALKDNKKKMTNYEQG